ncbi:hypothetical protein D3C74_316500 [compost metagenome]
MHIRGGHHIDVNTGKNRFESSFPAILSHPMSDHFLDCCPIGNQYAVKAPFIAQ